MESAHNRIEVGDVGGVHAVSYGADDRQNVRFYEEAIRNGMTGEFKTRVYIEIASPGDKTQICHRIAKLEGNDPSANDTMRFPRQWAAYKAGITQASIGTPIEQVAWLNITQRAQFKYEGIHTLEQLAGLDDITGPKIGMGWRELVNKARALVEAAKGNAPIEALANQNAMQAEQIEMLKQQLAALAERIPATEEQKRGTGRPRNNAAEAA